MLQKVIVLFFVFMLFTFIPFIHSPEVLAQKKVAYLTFDDGPSKNTSAILEILNEYQIDATFFVIGNQINHMNECLLKEMVNDGHYIGLHTMTHEFNLLYGHKESMNTFIKEILQEQLLIYRMTGLKSILVRPPYSNGSIFTNKYIDAIINLNFKLWDWTVDSRDWQANKKEEIIDKIKHDINLSKNPNIVVILFHERDITIEVLPHVINYLKHKGYVFKSYDPNHHIPVNFKQNPSV